jgi:hypothetical protein
MGLGLIDNAAKAVDFGIEDAAAEAGEAIIAAARIVVVGAGFFHEALFHEALQVVVESAGAQFEAALRLPGHFLHDGIPVHFLAGEGEQNVEGRWGEGKEVVGGALHYRNPLYQIPMVGSMGSV